MKLKIVQCGDPILRQAAKELSINEIQSSYIQNLIELMKSTMRDAPGVGLAAPQIGESIQLIVIEDRAEYTHGVSEEVLKQRGRIPLDLHVVINPRLTICDDGFAEFYEGCLSIAGLMGIVPRALAVRVECLNERAEPIIIEASGWYARILQHEIDHLQGRLCIDKTKLESLTTYDNYNKYHK